MSPSRWSAVCVRVCRLTVTSCTGHQRLPVFTCLCLFLLSPPEVSVLRILMGIALFSSYKMYTCFWSQSPFWPEFNHVFCKVPVPVLFVVICHIPGTTISFFYFDPFCIVCFCWFSYVQSNDQHWVFTTFWAHSKALCMDYLISCLTIQFSSVAHSCPTVCDPMNRSTPGLPVHHQLPEFTQTHVHHVSDAIQPSHPLSSPSPPAPNPSQHQSLFQWVNSSHEVAKVLEFQL